MDGHTSESEHAREACRMIAAQAESTLDEALALLRLRAESLGQSVHDTALDVLDHRISFRFRH